MVMKIAICENPVCTKEFQYRYKGKLRRYCCTQCAYPNKYLIKTYTNCPICGDLFEKIESNNKNLRKLTCGKKLCQKSRRNLDQYKLNKIDVICHHCNKTFQKTNSQIARHNKDGCKFHFCSFNCAAQNQSYRSTQRRIQILQQLGLDENSFSICNTCNLAKPIDNFIRSRRIKWMCKDCFYNYQSERWTNRKIWAIQYLGGKCLDCGYNGHWAAFDFHHRDPNQKEFDWSKLKLRSLEIIKAELDKCDILCACCHRIRHVISTIR